jgi:predicted  nucleic acid-binding Zn-ribbon protein
MSLSTRQLIDHLKSLQEVDLEVRKLRKEEARWPAILASRAKEVEAKRRKVQEAEEACKAARREIDKRELDLKTLEGAVRSLQVQQNTAKTNKEYTTFANEIALKKAEGGRIEEDVLKRMDALEELGRETAAARAALEGIAREQDKLGKQAESERREIRAEIEKGLAEREQRRARVPGDVLQQYERLAQGRDGAALAAVVDGVCQGCFINLTAQEINLLLREDKLLPCRNCQRFLFFEGAGPGAPPAPED